MHVNIVILYSTSKYYCVSYKILLLVCACTNHTVLIQPEIHVVLLKCGWMNTKSTIMLQDLQLEESHMESEFGGH